MPHVSKYRLKSYEEQKLKSAFKMILSRIGSKKDMDYFLKFLLSDTEQLMFSKRIAIAVLLKEGFAEVEIAGKLAVTKETVNRINLLMQTRGGGFEVAIRELRKDRMLTEFKKFLISLARYSIKAAGGRV